MRKIKIYLAKSNLCSLELAARVRSYLSSINNVELVEFNGGTAYNSQPLVNSDIVVVIPPQKAEKTSMMTGLCIRLEGIHVGRGLFQQVRDFTEKGLAYKDRRFIVMENDSGSYCLHRIRGSKNIATDWTINWGIIWYDDAAVDLDRIVEVVSIAEDHRVNQAVDQQQAASCVGTTGLICDISGDSSELDLKLLLIKRRKKQT